MKGRIALPLLLAMCAGIAALPASARAQAQQGQATVREITGQELTPERLIEVLKPRTAPPHREGARGIGPAETGKPQCEFYKKQRSRGIGPAPASDIAALQVRFAFNSADLTSEASGTLDTLGKALQSSDLVSCCFQIEGHTDALGGDAYNQKLSEKRARSVAHYLAEHFGLDEEQLLAVGYGKSKPIAENESDEGRQKNRRVQILTLGYGEAEEAQ